MNNVETAYKKYNKVEKFGSVRLEVEYKPLFHATLEKLFLSLQQSKTVRTADLRANKVRSFINEHVHHNSNIREELKTRVHDAYVIALEKMVAFS